MRLTANAMAPVENADQVIDATVRIAVATHADLDATQIETPDVRLRDREARYA